MSKKDDSTMRRELGISRRELLRRSAIVGGTLVWAAPVIQSITPPAYAQMGQSPGSCAACYCWNGTADKSEINGDFCTDNGNVGFQLNRDTCQNWCRDQAPGGPFVFSEYCSGARSCRCSTENDFDATLTGVECS
jgi:hypothetical protein